MTWFVDKLGPRPKDAARAAAPAGKSAQQQSASRPAPQAPLPRAAAPKAAPPPPEPPKKKKGWF